MSDEKRKTKDRYAKLGGRFWRHPKVLALSDGAGWMWTRALSYCIDQRTDGLVVTAAAKAIRPDFRRRAAELVDAGLWVADSQGWRFHDYADHNMTNEEWETEKTRKARNKADSRERSEAPRGNASGIHVTAPVTGDIPPAVTGDEPSLGMVTSDSGLRTQDSGLIGGETPPPPESLTAVIKLHWELAYASRLGPGAPVSDPHMRQAVTWIRNLATHHSRDATFVLDAILDAYWADPWTTQAGARPSLGNLLSQGDKLATRCFPPKQPKPMDPHEYNRIHGIPTARKAAS